MPLGFLLVILSLDALDSSTLPPPPHPPVHCPLRRSLSGLPVVRAQGPPRHQEQSSDKSERLFFSRGLLWPACHDAEKGDTHSDWKGKKRGF